MTIYFKKVFNKKFTNIFLQKRNASKHYHYDMPDKYKNCFYLANASFFDSTNWFIHNAYETVFSDLVEELLLREPYFSQKEAVNSVKSVISELEPVNELIDINFTLRKSNTKAEVIRGFRVHHGMNHMNRPCLGGLRLSPNLTKDQCKALSVLSTYRNACIGINLAGAHGGIKLHTGYYNNYQLKNAIQVYTKELAKRNFCGTHVDVIEPEMYCGPVEMSWIAYALGDTSGNPDVAYNACAVGKPSSCGGVDNYQYSTAEGVYILLNYFLNNKKFMDEIDLETGWENKTFILQGLGKTGTSVGKYLEKVGAKCVGIKEVDAFTYVPEGISVEKISEHKNKNGSILGYEKVRPYEVDDIYREECDILILAAVQKSLTCYLADVVKAKIIVEVANGPITPTAHKILLGRKKLVLPDIFVNSGSTIASFCEYIKSKQYVPFGKIVERYTSEIILKSLEANKAPITPTLKKLLDCSEQDIVFNALKYIFLNTLKDILEITESYKLGLDLRTAAYINAIKKIFRVIYDTKKY